MTYYATLSLPFPIVAGPAAEALQPVPGNGVGTTTAPIIIAVVEALMLWSGEERRLPPRPATSVSRPRRSRCLMLRS